MLTLLMVNLSLSLKLVTLSGAVMVDRKNSRDAVKMMHQVGEDMKRKGVSLWIFPEGTRSLNKENDMLPFKKGAFHLAVQGKARESEGLEDENDETPS